MRLTLVARAGTLVAVAAAVAGAVLGLAALAVALLAYRRSSAPTTGPLAHSATKRAVLSFAPHSRQVRGA